jgi:hypothetical protein
VAYEGRSKSYEGRVSALPEATAAPSEDSDESVLSPDAGEGVRSQADVVVTGAATITNGTRRLISRRLRGIESAWRDWIREHSGVSGGLWKVRLSLDEDGEVVGVELLSDGIGVPSLAKLFERQALGWTLGRQGDGAARQLEFELRFSATR